MLLLLLGAAAFNLFVLWPELAVEMPTLPLSVYWTGRRLRFGGLPAALVGMIASLLSTEGLISGSLWGCWG
jgi:hypothetical protein